MFMGEEQRSLLGLVSASSILFSASSPAPGEPPPLLLLLLLLLLIEAWFSVPAPADPHQGRNALRVHGVCLCVIETPCAQIR